MRHHALLDKRADDGSTLRDHLEEKLRRGHTKALERLEGPEPPVEVLYLLEWAQALYGRSGATMGGLAPLSYGTIRDWAALMEIDVTPLETQALMWLDAVMRNPEPDEPEPVVRDVSDDAWPEKSDG